MKLRTRKRIKNRRLAGPERAFTLTELLVILAVIVVLAGILAPALVGRQDRLKKTVCANNLRQIGVGMNVYASDNNGFVIAALAAGDSAWNPLALNITATDGVACVNLTASLAGGASLWSCPSLNGAGAPEYEAGPRTAPRQGRWKISYEYYGGVKTWLNPVYHGLSRSPVKMSNARPEWVLAADGVARNPDGTWVPAGAGLAPHLRTGTRHPDGANEVTCDGSVTWHRWEELRFLSSGSLDRPVFMDQSDLPAEMSTNASFGPALSPGRFEF